MSESANSLELISNLNKVIEKRGLNKTIEILKKSQQPEKGLQEQIIKVIKDVICNKFNITEKNYCLEIQENTIGDGLYLFIATLFILA